MDTKDDTPKLLRAMASGDRHQADGTWMVLVKAADELEYHRAFWVKLEKLTELRTTRGRDDQVEKESDRETKA